ncbi:MAG: ABC transporter ATP-binding protein [Blastocatellia bacterium AA13]|nr:MAG: ABC transporter ATP-binding protein [Blastocatellia bacterium AA13]
MIKLENLTKDYGTHRAVGGVNLEVPSGQLIGYLGPNGAGKSTTVKMLTGMMAPTSGRAEVCGFDTMRENIEVKRIIGYVPESGAVYETLTGREYLEMVGRLYGLKEKLIQERVEKFGDFFELGEDTLGGMQLSAYSKGMKQKIVISAALIHNPRVIFFDEPLNGLDASTQLMFKTLIKNLAAEGKTIFYCSHVLDVVERTCERIVIIDHGVVVADGTLVELQALSGEGSLEQIFNKLTSHLNVEERAEEFSRSFGF